MQSLRWERRPDGLRAPALVCAFKGWNDAGEAATSALAFIAGSLGADQFATIDPEDFVDFQSTRPMVRLVDGVTRAIDWPEFEVHAVRIPRAPRDLVLLSGPEPAMRWRTFSRTVVELAEALGVQMAVLLGALLADVPHSRPVHVTAHASDPGLVQRLELSPPTYEGPTGIVGVLHDSCRAADVSSASLWAAVPHYASLAASPKAALALCDRLAGLLGTEFDLTDLERASEAYETQVSEAVASDEETAAYVQQLEERRDALGDELDVPSGESLAAELTRFLREHEARREEEGSEDD
jgi:predicted ATP-grasp superfamily ATP-dependent carboligase